MAHKTKVGGTAYEIKGGRCKVGGTGYEIKKGRTKVGGTGYDVNFAKLISVTLVLPRVTAEKKTVSNVVRSGGTIYYNETQSVVFTAEEGMTYADLAESSEYNTYQPDKKSIAITVFVNDDDVPSVRFTSPNNGATADFFYSKFGDAADVALSDGMTMDFSYFGGNLSGMEYSYSDWTLQ